MKFSTSKTELQQALQKLSKATPTRSTLPILSCVLFESSEEKTSLRATDLEITIQVEIPVSLELVKLHTKIQVLCSYNISVGK